MPIEEIVPGELVLSRPEFDPEGAVEPRAVEEVFVRVSPVYELRVGGRAIRTTPEHPFWVRGRGWRTAKELHVGDEFSGHDGGWARLDGVAENVAVTTVYNLRVAEYHTYFVERD